MGRDFIRKFYWHHRYPMFHHPLFFLRHLRLTTNYTSVQSQGALGPPPWLSPKCWSGPVGSTRVVSLPLTVAVTVPTRNLRKPSNHLILVSFPYFSLYFVSPDIWFQNTMFHPTASEDRNVSSSLTQLFKPHDRWLWSSDHGRSTSPHNRVHLPLDQSR